jgi:hypothetical protein
MRLSFADAEAVARAVRRWTETGQGVVIAVEGEYRLLVGGLVVVLLVEGNTVYVDRVRRAR